MDNFNRIFAEELKTGFLKSLDKKYFFTTQDLRTPPELEHAKANFDKILAGLTEEKFSLTTQPPPTFECTNFNREMYNISLLREIFYKSEIDIMETFFEKKKIPSNLECSDDIRKVFTFDSNGNILNFNDYYYNVSGDSTNIKIFYYKMYVADIKLDEMFSRVLCKLHFEIPQS